MRPARAFQLIQPAVSFIIQHSDIQHSIFTIFRRGSAMSSASSGIKVSLPVSAHQPAPYDGPSRDEVLALRRDYLTPGLLTFYKEPLLVAEGHMQYVWDETGKQYLDAFAGIVTVSVGHCHPRSGRESHRPVGKTSTYHHHLPAPHHRLVWQEDG
jgi:hypothetical protein